MSSIQNAWRSSAGSQKPASRAPGVALRARRLFLLNALLGTTALTGAVAAVTGSIGSLHLGTVGTAPAAGQFTLLGLHVRHPNLDLGAAAALLLAAVGVAVLLRGLRAALGEVTADRRFARAARERAGLGDGDYPDQLLGRRTERPPLTGRVAFAAAVWTAIPALAFSLA